MQFACNLRGVQGAGAPEADHREVARIVTAFDRYAAHGQRHLRDRNLDDPERCLFDREFEGHGDRRADRLPRAFHVERHLAAEKAARAQTSEDDVRVGYRRCGAALTVTHGPRVTARAARTDLERADFIDPRDAAAAGADLDDVDDRQHDRMTARETTDVVA